MADGALSWVIGAGGLLGKAVVAEAARRDDPVTISGVPWHEPDASVEVLVETTEWLLGTNPALDVLWCAGAGVVGTSREELDTELAVFTAFLDHLEQSLQRHPRTTVRLFLASSAGGVYAGSASPPFTEADDPRPLAPYGETKLAMEKAAAACSARSGISVLVCRFANLYGPGQRLDKPQGIVSQLCRSQLSRQPLSIYVSLDTARDYIYVRDAARMMLAGMDLLAEAPAGSTVTKIVCSGAATTLAEIVGVLHRISKRRPPIVLGVSQNARYQPPDLRFRSTVWPALNALARTPLPEGMAATLRDVAADRRAARPVVGTP